MELEKNTAPANDSPNPQKIAAELDVHQNAVVDAGAGAGKTTTLANKVAYLVSDHEHVQPADRIAIMTFTRNAAAELRVRMNKALSDAAARECSAERKRHIKEQTVKFRRAPIVTINAFCLDVLKENIQLFDLPANFTILDEARAKILLSRALDSAMEYFYSQKPCGDSDKDFTDEERDLLFRLFSYKEDSELRTEIGRIYEKITSLRDYRGWLDGCTDIETRSGSLISGYAADITKKTLGGILDTLTQKQNVKTQAKNALYQAALAEDKQLITDYYSALQAALDSGEDYTSLRRLICAPPAFKPLSYDPSDEKQQKTADSVAKIRAAVGKRLAEYQSLLSDNCADQQAVIIRSMVKLIKLCDSEYSALKAEQGYVDFAECEHKLLAELCRKGSPLRDSLISRYDIIIIDEFQDTNDTQYAIFEQLTGDGSGCSLFVVGDVKQSIYAFRGGNPAIMSRLCGDEAFKRITLSKNYRSRSSVIRSVNEVFRRLMTAEHGEIEYSPEVELVYGNTSYKTDIDPVIAPLTGAAEGDTPDLDETYYNTEIHVLTDAADKVTREAEFIGDKILELTRGGFFVTDKSGKAPVPRRCGFGDIGILVRTKKHIPKIKRILEDRGIPVSSIGDAFLETEEISLILSYLKVIDNPMREKELLTVLMSPLYCMDANKISAIKLGCIGFDLSKAGIGTSEEGLLKQIFTTFRPLYTALNAAAKPFDTYKAAKQGADDYISAKDRINGFISGVFDENGAPREADGVPAAPHNYEDSLLQFFTDYYKYNRGSDDCYKQLTTLRDFYLLLEKRGAVREQGDSECIRFVERLKRFRSFKSNNSVERLVRKVYDDTDILSIMGIFSNGEKKAANLNLLLKYIAGFEGSGGGMLGDFLRYTDNAVKLEDNNTFAEAALTSGSSAVRIMTIHASKGLEMPIVFIAQLGEGTKTSANPYEFSRSLGIAVKSLDLENRQLKKTVLYNAIAEDNRRRGISEELRLLYVAMTRAREKLFMSAVLSKSSLGKYATAVTSGSIGDILEQNTPMLWILAALLPDAGIKITSKGDAPERTENKAACTSIIFSGKRKEDSAAEDITEEELTVYRSMGSEKCYLPTPCGSPERAAAIAENIRRRYGDERLTLTRSRYSVTEVAHMMETGMLTAESSAERVYIASPEFVSQSGYTGKEIGDAYHHAMQFLPFDSDPEKAADAVSDLLFNSHITEKEYDYLKNHTDKFAAFLKSVLCARAVSACRRDPENLQREKPFFTQVSTVALGLSSEEESADVFLQGRIDMFFIEEDGVVLVDYKSDSAESLKRELEAYQKQLRMYNDVLFELTGKPVKEIYIYSFTLNDVIKINPKE